MRYIKIRHSETGEEAVIDTYMSRYRNLGLGFLNSLKITPRFVKHIILTQKKESYHPNILNPFFVKLRRYYGDVVYLWSAEVQEERLQKYGESVLHWHIIVGFAYDPSEYFGKDDVLRIANYWKHGGCEIKKVRKPSVSYLLKYIQKALNIDVGSQIRRIGSSLIPAYLRRSWAKLQNAISFLLNFGETIDRFKNYEWNYKGAFIRLGYKERIYLYQHPSSCWKRVLAFDFSEFLTESF